MRNGEVSHGMACHFTSINSSEILFHLQLVMDHEVSYVTLKALGINKKIKLMFACLLACCNLLLKFTFKSEF